MVIDIVQRMLGLLYDICARSKYLLCNISMRQQFKVLIIFDLGFFDVYFKMPKQIHSLFIFMYMYKYSK